MRKDLENNLKVEQKLDPAVLTASETALASFDVQNYGSLMFLALVGQSGDTLSGSVYAELELEHSDDDSTFEACADADLSEAVTGTNTGTFAKIDDPAEDEAVFKVGYKGHKRYVRPVVRLTGTHTNGIPVGIVAVGGHGLAKPEA